MRAAFLGLLGAVLFLSGPGAAAADLLPPVPSLTGTIDGVLGGENDTTLPADAVDTLLGSLTSGSPQSPGGGESSGGTGGGTTTGGATTGGATGTTSATGASGASGPSGGATPTGAVASDRQAPHVTMKIASSLGWTARTGRLKARVTSDEPAVVAVGGSLRVGRKVLRLPSKLLGYRARGAQTLVVRLPAAARRALADARRVRVSLQAIAVDQSRNQARKNLKRTLTRARELAHLRHAHRSQASGPVHTRR